MACLQFLALFGLHDPSVTIDEMEPVWRAEKLPESTKTTFIQIRIVWIWIIPLHFGCIYPSPFFSFSLRPFFFFSFILRTVYTPSIKKLCKQIKNDSKCNRELFFFISNLKSRDIQRRTWKRFVWNLFGRLSNDLFVLNWPFHSLFTFFPRFCLIFES